MPPMNCEKYKRSNPNAECDCKDCREGEQVMKEIRKGCGYYHPSTNNEECKLCETKVGGVSICSKHISTPSSWEERFDEQFELLPINYLDHLKEIKSFIALVEKESYERGRREGQAKGELEATRFTIETIWEKIKQTDGSKTYRSVEIINTIKENAKKLGINLK